MINQIINFSIKNKLIIGLMTFALIGAGIWSMREVPIDAQPDITNNQVQVITVAPNLGTGDIEQFVTYPVELAMANLPSVTEIRSISRFGLSVVTIVFEDGMGTFLPRQLVSEKLNEVKGEIPEKFGEPFIGPITTGLGEVYQYTFEVDPKFEDNYDPQELRTIQDWIVKRQMAMVPGVVEVNSFGGTVKQYEVALNPNRLKSMSVSVSEIFEALNKNNENTGGAYIEKNRKANFIRGEGLYKSIGDIENTVVKIGETGRPVLIRDVAVVKIGAAVRYGAFTKNGKESVGGMVLMLKDENSNEVINNIKERIVQVQKTLPEGVSIEPFLDRSELIQNTTSTVALNLVEGGLIVIFVLVILLGNWRGGLIVASTIPLSLLFAFIMMNIFGVWANLMSLGAIDFGIIVDGAVIIVEAAVFYMTQHIHKNKKHNLSEGERDQISAEASTKMMNAAFFGQLIILIVFVPLLALTGVEGKMFKPMALTFGFAIIGAMILCLTYVPMVTALFLKASPDPNAKPGLGDKIMNSLHKVYDPVLQRVLKRGKAVIVVSVALLALSGWVFSRLGGEFIPTLDEGDLAMQALLKPGSSLTETIEASERIERILLESFPDEVEDVVARIGVAELPTDPMPMDIADMFIMLKPHEEWNTTSSKEELIQLMKEKVSALPGINYEFSQPVELRFNELLTGVRQDIAIKLYGEDLDVLAVKAKEIGKLIQGVDGVGDINVEATKGLPQMTVKYKRAKLAQYGLNVEDLNSIVSSAFAGTEAGVIFEGEKRFELVVRLDDRYKQDIESLRGLFVNLPNGEQVPLQEVAEVDFQAAPMQISREGTRRRVSVGVNARGRDVESTVMDIQKKLEANLKLPPGYVIKYGGAFENLQRAKARLRVVVPVALALIFVLLFFALKSVKQTIMIYMAIPLSAIGGILSLYLRDMPFSISAGVGFIVLFGVAVLNGLVLVTSLNELKERGVTDLKERILKGAHERLRPIMLTASTDILGFLPMAISSSAGAEVQRPLATVVIGGLLTSTLLTLIVIPVLYQWLERDNTGSRGFGAKPAVAVTLVLLMLVLSGISNAQENKEQVDLKRALELAKRNYPSLKKATQEMEASKEMRKTAVDFGKTDVYTGEEQVNIDGSVTTLVGVGQSFEFPTSYMAKGKLRKEEVALSERAFDLTENELVRSVTVAYYGLRNAQDRLDLALLIDSVYTDFERAARIRYETEETTRLEYIAAQSKVKSVEVRLTQARSDVAIAKRRLAQWLNIGDNFEIVGHKVHDSRESTFMDSTDISLSPFLKYAEQQVNVDKANLRVEKNGFTPDINVSYEQQKVGDKTGVYTYQVGIAVPLWFRSQAGRTKAAKRRLKASEYALEEQKLSLASTVEQTALEFGKIDRSVNYYESQAVPLADARIETAEKSYKAGAIDYVAYIQNLDESFQTKTIYLDYLFQYHQLAAELKYYIGVE
ncbi:CusA/CzcA family heavy metal efflux RND transporter [Fulvitalea axinellae]